MIIITILDILNREKMKNLIKTLILTITMSLLLTSCTEDDPLTCYETVTGYYLETYYQGYVLVINTKSKNLGK